MPQVCKPGARQPQAGTPGLLKSLSSTNECVGVCVCPRGHKYVILTLCDCLNNSGCFSGLLPSMSSIGLALVTKCVASYSQRRLR